MARLVKYHDGDKVVTAIEVHTDGERRLLWIDGCGLRARSVPLRERVEDAGRLRPKHLKTFRRAAATFGISPNARRDLRAAEAGLSGD